MFSMLKTIELLIQPHFLFRFHKNELYCQNSSLFQKWHLKKQNRQVHTGIIVR